jgi:hypothetical protein
LVVRTLADVRYPRLLKTRPMPMAEAPREQE